MVVEYTEEREVTGTCKERGGLRSMQRKGRFEEHAKKGDVCGECTEKRDLRSMQRKERFAEYA
jgi:hypothetical protein